MASVTPASRCHESGSWKKRMPAIAMIAAPPARIAGTAERGSAFLKQKEKSDCARADADARQHRVKRADAGELLIPPRREPQPGEINQDGNRRRCLDEETAQTIADVISSEPRKI